MKNIILFALAFTLLPLSHSFAQTNASNDDIPVFDSSTIDDFETAKVISNESSFQKVEAVKDIVIPIQGPTVRIAPTTTALDTNAEVIPVQSSEPAQAATKPVIDSEAIKKLLREHVPQFHSCYQKELDNSEKPEFLKGSLLLKFKIEKSGKVQESEITSQDFHSEKVQECIKSVLEGIKFPAGEKSVSIKQPMNLYSK